MPLATWEMPKELAEYMGQFYSVFPRLETFENACRYIGGLLSDLPRKNGEKMVEAIEGIANTEAVHRLMALSPWSAEELDRLRVAHALRHAIDRGTDVRQPCPLPSSAYRATVSPDLARTLHHRAVTHSHFVLAALPVLCVPHPLCGRIVPLAGARRCRLRQPPPLRRADVRRHRPLLALAGAPAHRRVGAHRGLARACPLPPGRHRPGGMGRERVLGVGRLL